VDQEENHKRNQKALRNLNPKTVGLTWSTKGVYRCKLLWLIRKTIGWYYKKKLMAHNTRALLASIFKLLSSILKLMEIVGFIPARLASTRFYGKVLHPIEGLPMIEHVRRRALLSNGLKDVYVATSDIEIYNLVSSCGGKVILTHLEHENGTSRIAEAVQKVACSHVVLIQGDEPLILPNHIDKLIDSINQFPNIDAWNCVASLSSVDELNKQSFVKCITSPENFILNTFRRSPLISRQEIQMAQIKKVLGILGFKKEFLLSLSLLPQSMLEANESIEQLRIIENHFRLSAVHVEPALPSINEPKDLQVVIDNIKTDTIQSQLFKKIK